MSRKTTLLRNEPNNIFENGLMPGSARIMVRYDQALQGIVGCSEEEAVISDEMLFVQFLQFLFSGYPQIEKQYPPGVLGFSVNGQPPSEWSVLRDGDVVEFRVEGLRPPWNS